MTKCILDIKSGKPEPWAALQLASYTLLDTPVEFQDEGHIYTCNGQRLRSTTEILKAKGFIDTTWYDERSRDKGRYVHLACHLDDIDDLDEDTVGEVERPYLESYRKFKRESGFMVEQSEVPMMSRAYQFAGTPDKIGHFPTGNLKRAAIALRPDGTYKLHPYEDKTDINIWIAELPGFLWQQNNLKRKD